MGLFGNLDAADIPDNPFYVAPGTYPAVLTEAKIQAKKDGSGSGLSFKWIIEDEDSEYNGQNISDWQNLPPEDLTQDGMTPAIRGALSRLKQRLTQMGLTDQEQDDLLEPGNLDQLIGMKADVTVTESADKNDPAKIYTNISKIEIEA